MLRQKLKILNLAIVLIPMLSYAQGMDTLPLNLTLNDSVMELERGSSFVGHIQRVKVKKKRYSFISTKSVETKHSLTISRSKDLDESDPNWKYNNPDSHIFASSGVSHHPTLDITGLEKGKYTLTVFGEHDVKSLTLVVK